MQADPEEVEAPRVVRGRATEPLGYLEALDGMRGYAMFGIMFYHARFRLLPGVFLGVSMFFTLSGFLVTSLLLREWATERAINMRKFWSRRFRRLLPAAWTTLLGVTIAGALGAWNGDQLISLRGDIPFSILQLVNWHFIFENRTYGGGFAAPTPVEHYWSLTVEEQFYLLLPLLVLGILYLGRHYSFRRTLGRLATVMVLLIVAGSVLNGLLARNSIDRAYFGTDTRLPEMLIGVLLACFTVYRLRYPVGRTRSVLLLLGWAGLVGTLALWTFGGIREQWIYPWGLLANALATAALIMGCFQGGLLARLLSWAPMATLGRMSYGVYLVHWPIFVWLTPARTGLARWPLFGIRVALSLAVATVMYHWLEQPIRHRTMLVGRRFAYTCSVVLPLILIGSFLVTKGAEPTSIIQRADPTAAGEAVVGGPQRRRVLIIGDRTADVLGTAISTSGAASDGDPVLVVDSSSVPDCGLVTGGWVLLDDGRVEQDVQRCGDALPTWSAAIGRIRPDLVVVIPSRRDAGIRRPDTTLPWDSPTSGDNSNFRAVELGTSLQTLATAAESVGAGIVVTSTPVTLGDSPSVLPPTPPLPDPEQEAFRATAEALMIASAPDSATQADPATRIAALNRITNDAAHLRGVGFADLNEVLSTSAEPGAGSLDGSVDGSPATLDIRSGAESLDADTAARLTGLVRGLVRTVASTPVAPVPPPRSLQDITIPDPPPPSPRSTIAADDAATILVVGDSLAYGIGYGLEQWATTQPAHVVRAARFGCPVARGGRFRFRGDTDSFDPECDWGEVYGRLVDENRPEVVMLSSSVWQLVDRQLPGDSEYRHLGDPLYDQYLRAEFTRAIDVLASRGATVAVLTSPYIESGMEAGFSGFAESDHARADRLNELIREVVASREDVAVVVDMQAWEIQRWGPRIDPDIRPDGIHFTDAASLDLAAWLGPVLLDLAHGTRP